MSNSKSLYNVNDYTDVELYTLLDLVNPTDRELEAKILMQIHKYEKIGTKSSQKLSSFFDDIYNHFFVSEDEDVVEGYTDIDEVKDKYQLRDQTEFADDIVPDDVQRGYNVRLEGVADDPNNPIDPTKINTNGGSNRNIAANNGSNTLSNPNGQMQIYTEDYKQTNLAPDRLKKTDVRYTQDLEYSRGKLNPLLQQTIRRIISIDSQYRSDKRTMSTTFSFNLSEPLKDVVSLKLYSVQIPYTWYTIGKAYGNNFFYFKGRSPGIDNQSGIHDIKVEIAPGNYSPAELIGEVNTTITQLKTDDSIDITFGNTSFSYNFNTSLSAANIELQKGYNESSYQVEFDSTLIPEYLGLLQTEYSTNVIRSMILDNYVETDIFIVTDSNNYFTINVYQDDYITLESSFDISINNGTYERSDLITHVKTVLSGVSRLKNTDCVLSSTNNYIDLTLQLSRIPNNVNVNTKMQVIFYDTQSYIVSFEDTIFSGTNSLTTSGIIGSEISETIQIEIDAVSVDNPLLVQNGQLLCTIKMMFYSGTKTTNYAGNVVEHNIRANGEYSFVEATEVLSYLTTRIKNYVDNDALFANTTIKDNQLTLRIKANDRIWTNALMPVSGEITIQSCFGFEQNTNNMDEIIGEIESQEQSGRYTISSVPHVYFTPNIDRFRENMNGINDLSFNVPDTINVGSYNLDEYIDAINRGVREYDSTHDNVFNSPDEDYVFENNTAFPTGTYAYLQNNIFQLQCNVNKKFDNTMYIVDFTNSIFDNISVIEMFPDTINKIANDVSIVHTTNANTNASIIDEDTIIFTLIPKNSNISIPVNGNERDYPLVLKLDPIITPNLKVTTSAQMDDIVNKFIQPVFDNYIDPISGIKIFEGTEISATPTVNENGDNIFVVSIDVVINKTLVAKNYRISFKDIGNTNDTWNSNLKILDNVLNDNYIDTSFTMTTSQPYKIYDKTNNEINIHASEVDTSGNILDVDGNILDNNGQVTNTDGNVVVLDGRVIYKVTPSGNVIVSGNSALPTLKPLIIGLTNNNIRFKAIEDGVVTSTEQNDIIVTIPTGTYFRDTLIAEINSIIAAASTQFTNASGTVVSIVNKYNKYYVKILTNLQRNYTTQDYNLVFYDPFSFLTCTSGSSSVQNTTWDTTIGWVMGFRNYTTYDMSVKPSVDDEDSVVHSITGNMVTIKGDTGLSTNLYNYFLICLDDFNQSHLNDGLVTITNVDTSIPLPSYANRSNFVCDPVTGEKVYSVTNDGVTNRLTEKQIYATQVAANSASQVDSIGSSVSSKSYGTGPFVTDVFGLIPMKVSGLANGSSYVEFGGTLQNQERSYFGPVNISRMSVKLVTDRGNLVDLNKANWSFSLICEQLNKMDPDSAT